MKTQISIKIENVNFNFSGATFNYGGIPFVSPAAADNKSNKPSFSDEAKGKTRYIPSSQPDAKIQEMAKENLALKNQVSEIKVGYKARNESAKSLQEALTETCKIRAELEEELKRKNKIIESLESESKQFRDLNSRQKAKVKAVTEILQGCRKLAENMEEKVESIEKEIEQVLYK